MFELNYYKMGDRIKQRRKQLGLTQERAAELANIALSTYTKIESGNNHPSLNTLIKISCVLSISMDELIFGEASDDVPVELLMSLKEINVDKILYVCEMLKKLAFTVDPDQGENCNNGDI